MEKIEAGHEKQLGEGGLEEGKVNRRQDTEVDESGLDKSKVSYERELSNITSWGWAGRRQSW